MQKINIVCVGRVKERFYCEAVAEYSKRLSRFVCLNIRELPEGRNIDEEAEGILRACRGYVIALCIEGKKLSSEAFEKKKKKQYDRGAEVTFMIGSSCGLSQRVKDRADLRLSFSDMTFPHQLMRVVLCEQIYRAYMINSGSEYHK